MNIVNSLISDIWDVELKNLFPEITYNRAKAKSYIKEGTDLPYILNNGRLFNIIQFSQGSSFMLRIGKMRRRIDIYFKDLNTGEFLNYKEAGERVKFYLFNEVETPDYIGTDLISFGIRMDCIKLMIRRIRLSDTKCGKYPIMLSNYSEDIEIILKDSPFEDLLPKNVIVSEVINYFKQRKENGIG